MTVPFSTLSAIHAYLSIMTIIAMGLAGCQALLIALQVHCLRFKKERAVFYYLPAVATLEKALFATLFISFILLSLLLLTGFCTFYPLLLHEHRDVFWQKTILGAVSWMIFALLLMGRYCYGLRGKRAIYGTLLAFCLLIFIYFVSYLLLTGVN